MITLIRKNTNVKYIVEMYIPSQGAESGPPLGTVLGNIGLNSAKFCKDFNDFTKELPKYFILKVRIFILDNRSYNFVVFKPSTSFILSLLKFSKTLTSRTYRRIGLKDIFVVDLFQILQLCKYKFSNSDLNYSFYII